MTNIPPLEELKKGYFESGTTEETLFTLLMYSVRQNPIPEIVEGLGKDLEGQFRDHVMAFAHCKWDEDVLVSNAPQPKLTLGEVRQFIDYYRTHDLLP